MKTFIFSGISCLLLSGTLTSQTLPNIQANAQLIPAKVQIDGKLSEWDGALKAFNKAIGAKYTIAHDTRNLYLAVSSNDVTTTAKILAGGISWSINTSGKTNLNTPLITFPHTNSTYKFDSDGWYVKTYRLLSDSTEIRNSIQQLNEIKVKNLNGVSDSIVSIYNEYGIKAKMGYTGDILIWEVSVPLERLEISVKGLSSFAYNVRLNGVPLPPRPAGVALPTAPPPPPVIIPRGVKFVRENEITVVTDFNGKYSLTEN